ncbi:hypothetical protein [Caloranaerobacter sp. DY30410]|uniref:hypothetical protein n=1 Tax=Caloranaerobacter sp. DY30410 TaxID=3238305 RepID=UPI003D03B848
MKFKILVQNKLMRKLWQFYEEYDEEKKVIKDFKVDTLEEAKAKVQELINKSYYKKDEIKIVRVYDFKIKVS